jgi:hypothetical protein
MIICKYLQRCNRSIERFKDGVLPGPEWCLGFEKRHLRISFRFAKNITSDRAGVDEATLRAYILELEKTIEGVPASSIYNYDETNLADDPGAKKVLVRRGVKYPKLIRNYLKASTSIMMCGSASDELLPPYVVYKASHVWNTWTTGGPPGTRYNATSSGWFDEAMFTDWFKLTFLRHLQRKGKLGKKTVLIGDNLLSHFSDKVVELCKIHNI